MKPQLTVYKASAGSGKTFTLAREYMTLVIDNPLAYRNILAVTFTNKATEEMKLRILSQLYGIAHNLSESKGYQEQIAAALPHLSERQIRANASTALRLLLHNYNYFRVQTIDTFFQSVLRNLARELDLNANLRISLNDQQVEQQAVDQLIEDLSADNALLSWILDYIKQKIDDDKSWNVIREIKKFGLHIFGDAYKEHFKQQFGGLNGEKTLDEGEKYKHQSDFFNAFIKKMNAIKYDTEKQLKQRAEEFFNLLESNDYTTDDFSNKSSGACSYFVKLNNGIFFDKGKQTLLTATVVKAMKDPAAWVKKAEADKDLPIYQFAKKLTHMLFSTEQERQVLVRQYKSADLTLRNLNQLRLLESIDEEVRKMNKEANRFMLSDTQTLLHSLIKDTDTPFIFEKIGTQLEHVMIDEFQDTSTVQWKNFKVLLEETMSHQDAGNLIVGDVKQSIYRWRSGDWKLLNNITDEFTSPQQLDTKTLDTNYRSDRNIITFNNAFFPLATEREYEELAKDIPQEAEQLKRAYADVEQKVPQKKPANGYVKISIMETKEQDDVLEATKQTLDFLLAKGVQPSKIAILIRGKKEIKALADYLMSQEEAYPLVSEEAFRLDASQAVNMLITALRVIVNPEDKISEATLQKYTLRFLGSDHIFEAEELPQLQKMPLMELAEQLFCRLHLGENAELNQQSAYVCAFFDKLAAYQQDYSCDIESFLAEWDETMHSESIQSDSIDGIRLITIHKSKGLEFDHVIMPFADWRLERSGDILWCTPQEAPFNELPLIPVSLSASGMKGSIYEEDYLNEHLQNIVDNMNLLYVAFTRACHSLFVICRKNDKNSRNAVIETILPELENQLAAIGQNVSLWIEEGSNAENEGEKNIPRTTFFEYGSFTVEEATKEDSSQFSPTKNVFMQPSSPLHFPLVGNTQMPVFRQSNKSLDFIEGDEEEEQQKHYIRMGIVLHELFSTIKTTDDIEPALRQLEMNGMLYDENISRERLEQTIRKRLESEHVAQWFSPHWKLFNECSVLSMEDGKVKEHRPDRVMQDDERTVVVDFKFGKQKEEHQEQVRQYMRLLSSLDSKKRTVEGYLWYVYPNKIVSVDL